MLSLDRLVELQTLAIQQVFDVDPELDDLSEYDLAALYLTVLTKPVIGTVSRKLGALGVPGVEKLPLDSFFSDTLILLGDNLEVVRRKIYENLAESPFSNMEMLYDEGHRSEDALAIELSLNSPALHSSGIFLTLPLTIPAVLASSISAARSCSSIRGPISSLTATSHRRTISKALGRCSSSSREQRCRSLCSGVIPISLQRQLLSSAA